jgi:S-(hydroxymethyl)glutathione dehydrogenase/alcohol dehydrogenase
MTDGGADYTFDATGNTEVMRTALEACHRGWGTSIIIGVAEAGKEISHPPVPARHRAQLARHRVRRGQGPHRRAQDRRHVHDRQDRDRPDDHPRPGLEEINKAFDLMHAGKSSAASWCCAFTPNETG